MPKNKPLPDAEKMRRRALARWEDEGGADACGPQVPGVAKDCDEAAVETESGQAADDGARHEIGTDF